MGTTVVIVATISLGPRGGTIMDQTIDSENGTTGRGLGDCKAQHSSFHREDIGIHGDGETWSQAEQS